jgi:hypothetical protein
MDANSEARLGTVMQWLATQVRQMAEILSLDPQPITLIVSCGSRTWAEQAAEYAKGRTAPGKVVTNAPPGHSWHNLGCAVDCAPEVVAGVIDWNASHPQWKRMEEVGRSLGLTAGADWPRLVDAPHFQYTGPYPEDAPDDEARSIYLQEGAMAFWNTIKETP